MHWWTVRDANRSYRVTERYGYRSGGRRLGAGIRCHSDYHHCHLRAQTQELH